MHLQQVVKQRPEIRAILVLLSLAPLYFASYRYRLAHPYNAQKPLNSKRPLSQDEFVNDWLDTHVVDHFTPSIIAKYCNHTEWRPNLIFNLDNANGGIGNVRGNMLDFVFSAIEAGASIVLPGMAGRSTDDISNVWGKKATFEKFFDDEWFINSLNKGCQQMNIYHPWANESMTRVVPGNYLSRTRRMDADTQNTRKQAVEQLDNWLKEKDEYSDSELTVVNLERTLWDVDTRNLPPGFRRNLAQLLRINPGIRQLAAYIVQRLSERYMLDINPRIAIPPNAFYGAHLRTEADAATAGWLTVENANFSAQTDAYIAHAQHHKLYLMYVASGNATDLELFRQKAAAFRPSIEIVSKLDLLAPEEASVLNSLTWDQQALVDYEVLQRSSVFGGFVKSSFSYNIAMARNQWLEDHARRSEPWFVQHSESGVSFDDGLSRIIGRDDWHEKRIPRGMWP